MLLNMSATTRIREPNNSHERQQWRRVLRAVTVGAEIAVATAVLSLVGFAGNLMILILDHHRDDDRTMASPDGGISFLLHGLQGWQITDTGQKPAPGYLVVSQNRGTPI